jgi:mRNA interferase RelE/StbE
MTTLRAFRKLEPKIGLMLLHAITDLSADAFPAASRELVNGGGLRRLRVADYRVIYEVTDQLVTVHEVGHRSEIYR